MSIFQKIRTSYTTQLSLWVSGFVLSISTIVIVLLASFSQDVIRDESIDATMQALENTALRIDNTLRQAEMTARLQHQELNINTSRIEQLIKDNQLLTKLQQTLPNAQLYVTRRDSSQFDSHITGEVSGYRQMQYDDKEVYIFSQPLGSHIYNLTAVCPAQDLQSRNKRMQNIILSWSIITLVILLMVLYNIIAHHLRPLHILADTAQAITNGNLNTPIADSYRPDETGRLQNSLSLMQRKMTAYIDEMQQKRNTLNRQNAELQAAYDEAKAYEDRKARFLRNMTDRMAAPVSQLCNSTETVCKNYPDLSQQDMATLQGDIMQSSQNIVTLLDELIKNPSAS